MRPENHPKPYQNFEEESCQLPCSWEGEVPDEARRLYEEGLSGEEIVKKLCLPFSGRTLLRALRNDGVEIRKGQRSRFETDDDEIKTLYEGRKKSLRRIAEDEGCSHPTILLRLEEMGIDRRLQRHRRIEIPVDELISLRDANWTFEEIAKKYDCSAETVRQRWLEIIVETSIVL